MYPEWGTDIGRVPPFEWSNASEMGNPLALAQWIFSVSPVGQMLRPLSSVCPNGSHGFMSTPLMDALSPQIEEAGGRVVFVGAHTLQGQPLNATQLMLAESTPQGNGVRVGRQQLIWPATHGHTLGQYTVGLLSDARSVIATQTARGAGIFPMSRSLRNRRQIGVSWPVPSYRPCHPTAPKVVMKT